MRTLFLILLAAPCLMAQGRIDDPLARAIYQNKSAKDKANGYVGLDANKSAAVCSTSPCGNVVPAGSVATSAAYGLGAGAAGAGNAAFGVNTLPSNTGDYNAAFGYAALFSNVSGTSNTAVGMGALYFNTSNYNTAVGFNALYNNVAEGNTGVGTNALVSNTSGVSNTAVGVNALRLNTVGPYNTAMGAQALQTNNGEDNTCVGSDCAPHNVTGKGNTGLGSSALHDNLGDYNVGLGYYAGKYSTGSYGFYIDSIDRGSHADEINDGLMYGLISATPANQFVQVNAGTFSVRTRGAEIVTNGSFTTDTTDWTAVAATLAAVTGGIVPGGTIGGNALQLTNTGDANGWAQWTATTVAGTRYVLSWFHKNGTASQDQAFVGTSPGGAELVPGVLMSSESEWTQHSVEFVATGATTYLNFGTGEAVTGKTGFYDEISFKSVVPGIVQGAHRSGDGTVGFTGTCAAGSTITVKDGLITGCS